MDGRKDEQTVTLTAGWSDGESGYLQPVTWTIGNVPVLPDNTPTATCSPTRWRRSPVLFHVKGSRSSLTFAWISDDLPSLADQPPV